MQKTLITLLFSSTIIFTSIAQKDKFSCATVKSKNSQLKSNTLNVAQIAQTERYDVHYYFLDLNMTNLSTALSGTVEIHSTSREVLDSVWFELFDTFTITDLRLNGVTTPYNRQATAIKVPVNLLASENFIIAVDYNGTPPTASSNPLGGSGMTNDTSPSWGNQVTWSLSEPFSAFEWFPCKQSLKDKADSVAVNITVPSACKAGSNGVLTQVVDLGNGFSKYCWKHNFPIDYYLISVAVAEYVDYTVYANPVGAPNPVPIQNYIYNNPNTLPNFQADIDETVNFIEYFSDIFGLYPFHTEKYGHCMAPLSGGMEHQTMTTQGFFEKTLTAHELAHQWWGDHVTCKSWADIWVNEGFASYAEYLMLENMYPGEQVADMNSRHNNIKSQVGGSIWVEDSLNGDRVFSSRLTYDKGAAFVHTLRFILNDSAQFMLGLRNYQTAHAFDVALGTDVQYELEQVSGLDLASTFEQWYYGEGFPTYSAKWNLVNGDLYLNITHTASKPSVTPTFTNPLEIRFLRAGMSDTTIRLDISSNDENYILSGLSNVSSLANIDPKNWIINNNGTIVRDLTLGTNGISETNKESELTISPNPAADFITVDFASTSNFKLKILDPKGKLVQELKVKSGEKINVSEWSTGLYLFQFESENGERIIRKIVRK
ncbi:MAG: M1 family aminopeptidase [Flavobacteriia bacterium]|jgi:aminopeptidase N